MQEAWRTPSGNLRYLRVREWIGISYAQENCGVVGLPVVRYHLVWVTVSVSDTVTLLIPGQYTSRGGVIAVNLSLA